MPNTTETRFVRPREGVDVFKHPAQLRQRVAREGERLPLDQWLRRRMAEGDLIECPEPKASAAAPLATEATKQTKAERKTAPVTDTTTSNGGEES